MSPLSRTNLTVRAPKELVRSFAASARQRTQSRFSNRQNAPNNQSATRHDHCSSVPARLFDVPLCVADVLPPSPNNQVEVFVRPALKISNVIVLQTPVCKQSFLKDCVVLHVLANSPPYFERISHAQIAIVRPPCSSSFCFIRPACSWPGWLHQSYKRRHPHYGESKTLRQPH